MQPGKQMDADEYQRLASRTASHDESQRDRLLNAALGLCGEAGEIADHINKGEWIITIRAAGMDITHWMPIPDPPILTLSS